MNSITFHLYLKFFKGKTYDTKNMSSVKKLSKHTK